MTGIFSRRGSVGTDTHLVNSGGPSGRSRCRTVETNLTGIHEDVGFDPWPHSVGGESGVAVNCGIGRRCGLDPVLLWLWCRPAAAAPIRCLTWELPYAAGMALKKKAKKPKTKTLQKTKTKNNGGPSPMGQGSTRSWERGLDLLMPGFQSFDLQNCG